MNAITHAKFACLLGVVHLASFTAAQARTIYVDSSGTGDYPTLRAAVAAAASGDTIVVATGTYKGTAAADLTLAGKTLTIRSSDPNDPAVVARTIIDCWVQEEAGHRFINLGPNAELTLAGLTIINSSGSHSGGVVLSEDSVLTVVNCAFANNAVLQWGAVFRCENSHATFRNCTFSHNRVSSTLHAGAVYGRQSTLVFENCQFIDNVCKGIVAIDSRVTVSDCTFENNTGREGGAIYSHVPLGTETGDHLIVTRSMFVDNSATGSGGAIHSYAASPTISQSTFIGNTALVDGGAVYNHRCDTPSIVNCLFSDNQADGIGGAVTDFYRCRSEIVHCTFVGNKAAKGGAVASIRNSHPLISQSILWQNEANQGRSVYIVQDIVGGAPSQATIEYSDVQFGRSGVAVELGNILNWAAGNIDADPLFADPSGNDFRLSSNSPCVNAGDPRYVPPVGMTDLDGLPRLHGEAVDMGAYEFQGLGLTKRIIAGAMLGEDERTQYVGVGTEITYQICINNHSDTQRVEGLSVVDILPAEVTFVSADGAAGSYDRDRHVYTWSFPSLMPESTVCVALVARVRSDTALDTVITNHVIADSVNTSTQRASVSAVVAQPKPKPLELTKTITAGIRGRDERGIAYVAQGREITYQISVRNDNDRSVNNVVITDTLPARVTFVSAEGVAGSYDHAAHTYTWIYPTLAPGVRRHVTLTVRLAHDVDPGRMVVNTVHIDADEVPPGSTSVEARVIEAPLDVALTLSPLIIGRTGHNRTQITAVLEFPPQIGASDIDLETISLDPGNILTRSRTLTVVDGTVRVRAVFDLAEVLGAIPDNGTTTLYVSGRLRSQHPFVGEGNVLVVGRRAF